MLNQAAHKLSLRLRKITMGLGRGHVPPMQWRRFMLKIGGTSAEGASIERRRREDRGAEGSEGDRVSPWGRGLGEKNSIFELKRRVLFHSGCYFCS